MDVYDLEFENSSFDTVCISNSIHHLRDWNKAYSEIIRVLKPGGNLVINEMYSDTDDIKQQNHVLLHHWVAGINTISGLFHRETYEKDELLRITENAQIDFSKIIYYSFPEISQHDMISIIDLVDDYCRRLEKNNKFHDLKGTGKAIRKRITENGYSHAPSMFMHGFSKKNSGVI